MAKCITVHYLMQLSNVSWCMFSDVWLVILKLQKRVTRYGIWFGRMACPMRCSVQCCCSKYGFRLLLMICLKCLIAVQRIAQGVTNKMNL